MWDIRYLIKRLNLIESTTAYAEPAGGEIRFANTDVPQIESINLIKRLSLIESTTAYAEPVGGIIQFTQV